MNREETIELWEQCEVARAEARMQALAGGKAVLNAEDIAHEAAKAVWNGWAKKMLTRRKALEEAGEWAAEKDMFGDLEAQNEATRAWMAEAAVDFSGLHFQTYHPCPSCHPRESGEPTAVTTDAVPPMGSRFRGNDNGDEPT